MLGGREKKALTKIVYESNVRETRRRGRPRSKSIDSVNPLPYGRYVCDVGGSCYSPMALAYVTLVYRNYCNTQFSNMMPEVCKESGAEGVNYI